MFPVLCLQTRLLSQPGTVCSSRAHISIHAPVTSHGVCEHPPSFLSQPAYHACTASHLRQVEGAWDQDGRTPSIWDTFSHTPGNVKDNATGDVACDQYHLYPQDFAMMQAMGIKNYRWRGEHGGPAQTTCRGLHSGCFVCETCLDRCTKALMVSLRQLLRLP